MVICYLQLIEGENNSLSGGVENFYFISQQHLYELKYVCFPLFIIFEQLIAPANWQEIILKCPH